MDILTIRTKTELYLPQRTDTAYADVFSLHGLFDRLAGKTNLVLRGPKGTGKSLAIYAWAQKNQIPLVTVDCSEDMRASKLLGSYTIRGNETPFVLGAIPTAFEIANEYGRCVLCFEEIDALPPAQQKLLNPVLDFRRRVEIPETGRVYELAEGNSLLVIGTMNAAGYGGTHQLNEDLRSRIDFVLVDYPEPEDETRLVLEALTDAHVRAFAQSSEGDSKHTVLGSILTLARETRQLDAFAYALAPRDVVQFLRNASAVGVVSALCLLLGKYEGDERSTIRARMLSIFEGVTLPLLAGEK